MYTYKCYYHPKEDGAFACKGCKLPVCQGCEGDLGFCPECMRRRDSVHQLRQLRGHIADNARKSGSTTARLRLAIRQMSPGKPMAASAKPSPSIAGPSIPATAMTRPLQNDAEWQAAAMATPRLAPKKPAARRRSTGPLWKYDPDKLAYRAPDNLHETRGKRAKPAAQKKLVVKTNAAPAGLMQFLGGLGFGLVLLVGFLMFQMMAQPAAKTKNKPLYTPLSKQERQVVQSTMQEVQQRQNVRMIDLPNVTDESSVNYVTPQTVAVGYAAPAAASPISAVRRAYAAVRTSYVAPRTAYVAPRVTYTARRIVRRSYAAAAPAQPVRYTRSKPSLAQSIRFTGGPGGAAPRTRGGTEIASW